MNSYQEIFQWKQDNITSFLTDTTQLNLFHDEVMRKVYVAAVSLMDEPPPCPFNWFVTGSGGRGEQGWVSDQDHGIVYLEKNSLNGQYFSQLGKELSDGLALVGYPYCEGNVMSSNSLWCKPIDEWKSQLTGWMDDNSWSSVRNLQIFYDARTLVGHTDLLLCLKKVIHDYCDRNPHLLQRFYENIKHVKTVIGPLGQLLVEEKGVHAGAFDLKYGAFIPYVNGVRLLALREGLFQTSTLERLAELMRLSPHADELSRYAEHFSTLLELRLNVTRQQGSYDDSHFLAIKQLSKQEQKELKSILKDAKKLQQLVQRVIERGESYGI